MSSQTAVKRDFDGTMWLLGAVVAAPAFISLIQNVFDVGLNWYFADFISYYRRILAPVVGVFTPVFRALFDVFDWRIVIDQRFKDLLTLSLLGGSITARGMLMADRDFQSRPVSGSLVVAFAATLSGISGIGLLSWIMILWVAVGGRTGEVTPEEDAGIRRAFWVTAAAVAAFYVANAAMPRLSG